MTRRHMSWPDKLRAFIGRSLSEPLYRIFRLVPHWEFGLSTHTITNLTYTHGALAGRRAVHLSDLHLDHYRPRHDAAVETVARQRPDWIFITGDLLNVPEGLPHLFRFLTRLREIAPVFITLGNHDHYSGVTVEQYGELADRHDITLLVNEHTIIQTGSGELAIAGVDDPSLHRADLNCVPPSSHQRFTLLLAHAPNILDQMEPHHEVDLILCGHSHGGQWRIPWVPTFWLPPGCSGRIEGEHRSGEHKLYINRGMGWSFLPLRWQCEPEIVVIDWVNEQIDAKAA